MLNFRTYHPQGMAKMGKYFYLSPGEMIVEPEKFVIPQNAYDRTPGKGVGHTKIAITWQVNTCSAVA